MAEKVASLLRRSLDHLASEVPDSYRQLVAEMGPLVVELHVDGEIFALRGGQWLEVTDAAADTADARVSTSRATILDVLDANIALGEAVQAGRMDVRGPLEDVVRVHDALIAYANAAVRAPSMPGLLDGLRAGGAR